MKEGIHPEYKATKVVCACGAVIETRSVRGDFHIEICSACHPFFTGKQKIMDTAGRIEKFKNRYGETSSATMSAAPAKKVEPLPSAKKVAADAENRAAKRAKANAGKPKKEAAPAAAEGAASPSTEPQA